MKLSREAEQRKERGYDDGSEQFARRLRKQRRDKIENIWLEVICWSVALSLFSGIMCALSYVIKCIKAEHGGGL